MQKVIKSTKTIVAFYNHSTKATEKIRALRTVEPAKSQIGHRLPNKMDQHIICFSVFWSKRLQLLSSVLHLQDHR